MKKFLGVLVVVALCICMIVPAATAKGNDLSSILEGVDVGSLTDGELASILKGLDLDGLDTDAIKKALGSDSSSASKIEGALKNLGADSGSDSSTGSDALSGISNLLGGIDLSKISGLLSDPSAITDMFGGLLGGSGDGSGSSAGGFDISSLMDTISGAFSGAGFDLGSLTEGFDLGSFDFGSILGGLGGGSGSGDSSNPGQSSNGAMDVMSGIMDKLTSGLASLGIDTSAIEGLLDNELINFFANMYIGLGEVIKPGEKETTTAPVTSKPAVVTKKNPKTGDTSDVFVALGVLTVASAAAFVCLKKKKEN